MLRDYAYIMPKLDSVSLVMITCHYNIEFKVTVGLPAKRDCDRLNKIFIVLGSGNTSISRLSFYYRWIYFDNFNSLNCGRFNSTKMQWSNNNYRFIFPFCLSWLLNSTFVLNCETEQCLWWHKAHCEKQVTKSTTNKKISLMTDYRQY